MGIIIHTLLGVLERPSEEKDHSVFSTCEIKEKHQKFRAGSEGEGQAGLGVPTPPDAALGWQLLTRAWQLGQRGAQGQFMVWEGRFQSEFTKRTQPRA